MKESPEMPTRTPRQRAVETFNTHLMSDALVRHLATGRDDELADIMAAVRQAASRPQAPPPALIVYGERGSGKSFLMRLVQMACAEVSGVACVLLPEEHYNIRSPQKLLQVVATQVRGQAWTEAAWALDPRPAEQAWEEELAGLQTALDARFGPGQGLAVVLLENLDLLLAKLFGATAPEPGARNPAAVARAQDEERLRKLMNARGGRFMLVASATGTVDMDYERPLFQAFRPVDLSAWSADTAIAYYNRRRALDGLPALNPAEQARAQAITAFIGGNARLAQLLGQALSQVDIGDISALLDALVDQLADYYRQRLDALPPAAAGLLDALIRGGEPVSQSGLAQRVGGEQRQIADAFRHLLRGRLVEATGRTREAGGAPRYRVRDRLFVHFYRRRYGQASTLAAIAELLERLLTPAEREQEVRERLLRGEFADARAFGRLPISEAVSQSGFCLFRDSGITDGPDHPCLEWAGLNDPADRATERQRLSQHPDQAFKLWSEKAQRASTPLQRAASQVLAAVAASRHQLDQLARSTLDEAVANAQASGDVDAQVVANDSDATFRWWRVGGKEGQALALQGVTNMAAWAPQASNPGIQALAWADAALVAYRAGAFAQACDAARQGLALAHRPGLRMSLLYQLTQAELALEHLPEAEAAASQLLQLARAEQSLDCQTDALGVLADIQARQQHHAQAASLNEQAAEVAKRLNNPTRQADLLTLAGWLAFLAKNTPQAHALAEQAETLSCQLLPVNWAIAACAAWVRMEAFLDDRQHEQAFQSALHGLAHARMAEDPNLLANLLGRLIYLAVLNAEAQALTTLGSTLDEFPAVLNTTTDWRVPDNWLGAAARADAWREAHAIAQRHPRLLEKTPDVDWQAHMRTAPTPWLETARTQGRAAAYAAIAQALPAIQALWTQRFATPASLTTPPAEHTHSTAPAKAGSFADSLRPMVVRFSRECADPGLLRDIADLLESTTPGAETAGQAFILRAFADFHAAPDKERHLHALDPDLAIALRSAWNLPEPGDRRGSTPGVRKTGR